MFRLQGTAICSNLYPRDVLLSSLHLSLIPLLRPGVREGGREEGRKGGEKEEGRRGEILFFKGGGGDILLCSYNLYPKGILSPLLHLNSTQSNPPPYVGSLVLTAGYLPQGSTSVVMWTCPHELSP